MMNGDGTNPNKEVAREGETERGGIMQLSRRARRRCTDVPGRESEAKKMCSPFSLLGIFARQRHLARPPRREKIWSAVLPNEAGKFKPDASLFNSQKPRQ